MTQFYLSLFTAMSDEQLNYICETIMETVKVVVVTKMNLQDKAAFSPEQQLILMTTYHIIFIPA